MNKKLFILTPLIILLLLLTGCNEKRTVIGLSLAGSGDWSQKLYEEIKVACYQYPDVQLDYYDAEENVQLQEKQLNKLIDKHVSLIICSPRIKDGFNDELTRAKEAGIPVIIVDRKARQKTLPPMSAATTRR